MSQILRIGGRLSLSTFRTNDKHTVCESCYLLRNGYSKFSTQTKLGPNQTFFRRRRKKKQLPDKKELHQQLVKLLDASLLQSSASTGKGYRYLESEVPLNIKPEFCRLNKDNLRLGYLETDRNFGNLQQNDSELTEGVPSNKHSKDVTKAQVSNVNYSSVIAKKEYLSKENELDMFEGFIKKRYDGFQRQHINKPEDQKKEVSTPRQSLKTGKEEIKFKKGSRKKRNKAELHELYERKSKKIHDKKVKRKEENEKNEQINRKLLKNPPKYSKLPSNLNVALFEEGLNEVKALFKYEPADSNLEQLELLHNDESNENVQGTEDGIEVVTKVGEESLGENRDSADNTVEEGESLNDVTDTIPEAELAVLKALRRRKKDVPQALTLEEWDELEMMHNVFHEDTTAGEDIKYDHIVSDWAPDVKHIEGILTSKAQKKLKEKQKKEKWKHLTVDEDLILHSKQEIFNEDLLSYVGACISVGIADRALEDIRMYRAKNDIKYKITDVRTYNLLLRGLGKEETDLSKVRDVFSYIREDGLSPTLETYMVCLSCIGKSSDYNVMMASLVVRDMINEGLDVKDIFNKCTFVYNERCRVYQILKEVIPDFEPNPPIVRTDYSGELVEPLNEMLPNEEKVEINPFTCGMSKQEILNAAEEQFVRELDGLVTVNSIFKSNMESDDIKNEVVEQIQEQWRKQIKDAFLERKSLERLRAYRMEGINIYPFLCLFPDDDYVNILCQELNMWLSFSKMFSPACAFLRKSIITKIKQRFSIQQMIEMDAFPKVHKAYSTYISHLVNPEEQVKSQRELWKETMENLSDGNNIERPFVEWSESIRLTIGDIFFDLIVKNTKFDSNITIDGPKKMTDAFFLVERSRDGTRNLEVRPNPTLITLLNAQADLIMPTETLPSLCPPVPFLGPRHGGNFISTVNLLRWCTPQQIETLEEKTDEAGPVLDSLNILSTYAWKVNKPVPDLLQMTCVVISKITDDMLLAHLSQSDRVLDVAIRVFKEGGDEDLDIPILPESIKKPRKLHADPTHEERKEYNKQMFVYRKSKAEAVSLWWSGLYKLSIANQLRDRTFWLTMNIDFRGRSYPVAPHLQHQNQDYVKALLMFAKGKPLGEKGFYWLKVHLVNLTEHKKRASFEERLKYADEMMPEICDSADNPLNGNKWWMTSEQPWQTLAACKEVAAAVRSGDPSKYVSHYPVHQDGSCNGLQHYAALGRDVTGARSVNLKQEGDFPADVYSDVVDLVRKEIEYDIQNETKDYVIAKICEPFLERKVIKQSIMTTVYGVTMYGAKLQIQRQLGYKEFPREHILVGSAYLAEKTFQCLSNLFTSARQIQEWFNKCSVAISKGGQAVEWVTPLNLLCIQPYYKSKLQPPDMPDKIYNYLTRKTESLRVADIYKQKNGFAPNFIHSLDSTHMMLTSLYCYRKGLTYASVHDSYWTHPCDVDIMSKVTREQFIALHKQPILPNLSNYFIERYIHSGELNALQYATLLKTFTDVPGTGEFDLDEIQHSPFFFS